MTDCSAMHHASCTALNIYKMRMKPLVNKMQHAREVFNDLVERIKLSYSNEEYLITRSNPAGDVIVFSFPSNVKHNGKSMNTPSALKACRKPNNKVAQQRAMKLEMKMEYVYAIDNSPHATFKFRMYDYENVFNKNMKDPTHQMYFTHENRAKGFEILFINSMSSVVDAGKPFNAGFQFTDNYNQVQTIQCFIRHEGNVDDIGVNFWLEPEEASRLIPDLIGKMIYAANLNYDGFMHREERAHQQRIDDLNDQIHQMRQRAAVIDADMEHAGDISGTSSDSD